MEKLIGSLSGVLTISGELSPVQTVTGELRAPERVTIPEYEGAYEVTPSDESIVLETAGLETVNNIVINPIPPNYGKITWDGRVITVS